MVMDSPSARRTKVAKNMLWPAPSPADQRSRRRIRRRLAIRRLHAEDEPLIRPMIELYMAMVEERYVDCIMCGFQPEDRTVWRWWIYLHQNSRRQLIVLSRKCGACQTPDRPPRTSDAKTAA